MSYFAKPNFIIYDEWFDDDLEKTKIDLQNKKIKTISNIHEFFYEQSNYKIGASENNFQLNKKVNEKELITKKNFENFKVSNKKSRFFSLLSESKLGLNITKKFMYYLSIFGFVFIFGFLLFFISESRNNESNIINKSSFLQEKEYLFSKKAH